MLPGAKKDNQLITRDWNKLQRPIEGVRWYEIRHVPGNHGVLTEVFRMDWGISVDPVVQVFQFLVHPRAINAWHCHAHATDRLFMGQGHLKIVLFDSRPKSETKGLVNEFHVGEARPTLLVVPPGVWHGVQNIGRSDAFAINLPTIAYRYEDPDHWRLPVDNSEIPYNWGRS